MGCKLRAYFVHGPQSGIIYLMIQPRRGFDDTHISKFKRVPTCYTIVLEHKQIIACRIHFPTPVTVPFVNGNINRCIRSPTGKFDRLLFSEYHTWLITGAGE